MARTAVARTEARPVARLHLLPDLVRLLLGDPSLLDALGQPGLEALLMHRLQGLLDLLRALVRPRPRPPWPARRGAHRARLGPGAHRTREPGRTRRAWPRTPCRARAPRPPAARRASWPAPPTSRPGARRDAPDAPPASPGRPSPDRHRASCRGPAPPRRDGHRGRRTVPGDRRPLPRSPWFPTRGPAARPPTPPRSCSSVSCLTPSVRSWLWEPVANDDRRGVLEDSEKALAVL